jgi:cytochrome c
MRRVRLALSLALTAVTACGRDGQRTPTRPKDTGSAEAPEAQPTPPQPRRFGDIGRVATAAEITAWNIDVNSSGIGLPRGSGTYARGAALFAERCAACHGARGEGIPPFPRLIGREPREGFPFGLDARYPKTVGNYWPYATTLYDYINRAMPFTAPGSLRPDDVYSLVAFILAENEIVDKAVPMDAHTLRAVRMPARDRFVADNRTRTSVFR